MSDGRDGAVSAAGEASAQAAGSGVEALYVHAPFCARRCFYCDFAVTVSRRGDLEGWVSALARELVMLEEEGLFLMTTPLRSLFVGGGTPSILGSEAMSVLGRLLGPDRLKSPDLEWTAEANPESFTPEVARAWGSAGVNRVSLGAQSFQESVLRWMGRLHGPRGPAQAVAAARGAGITNISLDLIFGLPDSVERDWEVDLERALALEVPHLSLYGLSVEPQTPLGRAVAEGSVAPVQEERYAEEFLLAAARLREAGYEQYELSNFALPGFECRHNQAYWDYRPYLGLGNGAHSFQPPLRRWNLRDWREYQNSAMTGESVVADQEVLEPGQVRLERIWLGLRTGEGLPWSALTGSGRSLVRGWVSQGRARQKGSRVVLTPEGWLVLDRLAVALDDVNGFDIRYLDLASGPLRS